MPLGLAFNWLREQTRLRSGEEKGEEESEEKDLFVPHMDGVATSRSRDYGILRTPVPNTARDFPK